eukprot:3674920-Rhodomonas_salina.1
MFAPCGGSPAIGAVVHDRTLAEVVNCVVKAPSKSKTRVSVNQSVRFTVQDLQQRGPMRTHMRTTMPHVPCVAIRKKLFTSFPKSDNGEETTGSPIQACKRTALFRAVCVIDRAR